MIGNMGSFFSAIISYYLLHESLHIIISLFFDEFHSVKLSLIGPEIIYKSEIAQRMDLKWGIISGMSNFVTIITGYILLVFGKKIIEMKWSFIKKHFFYLTIAFLLVDPINLVLGPFIYGGDALGISQGFGINLILLQVFFFIVLMINREFIIRILFPVFHTKTRHFFFQPLQKKR